MGRAKLTIEVIQTRLDTMYNREYTVLPDTDLSNGYQSRIHLRHEECGKEYYNSSSNLFVKKQQCKCTVKKLHSKEISDINKVLEPLYYIHETGSKNLNDQITVTRTECNHTFTTILRSLLDPRRKDTFCPVCNHSGRKINKVNYIDILNKNIEDKYGKNVLKVVSTGEITSKSTIDITLNKCGHTVKVTANDLSQGSYKLNCQICKKHHPKNLNMEDVKKQIEKIDPEYKVLDTKYVDTHTPIRLLHTTCGNEIAISRTNFINTNNPRRCKHCSTSKGYSNAEKEILDYITSLLPNEKIIFNDRKLLSGKELDIFIPARKIAFEYNGLYWHSESRIGKNYHLEKTEKCLEKEVRLVHIFEHEWENKTDIVKSKISHILGVQNGRKNIYARKCTIKEIDTKVKNDFLTINHIQDKDNGSIINLGMYYEDKLVSVMTFCKPRLVVNTSTDFDYELSRFASDINYNVVGGFSKLMKYFERNYKKDSSLKILTFADLKWTSPLNNVYETNGYEFLRVSKPSYWYFNGSKVFHRSTFMKHKLSTKLDKFDSSKTEYENMLLNGYDRYWDCGNLVFELNL